MEFILSLVQLTLGIQVGTYFLSERAIVVPGIWGSSANWIPGTVTFYPSSAPVLA